MNRTRREPVSWPAPRLNVSRRRASGVHGGLNVARKDVRVEVLDNTYRNR
jgi:hypothetical protein